MRFIWSPVLLCLLIGLLLAQAQSQSQNEKFNNYNNYNNNNNYNPFISSAQQVQQQQQQQQQQQHQHQHQQHHQQLQQQQQQQLQQQQHQQQQQQRPIITTANSFNTFGHQQSNTVTSKPKDQQKDYVDYFNHRYPDGSYEFRYELTDGTARYERGYYMLFDKIKVLVVVGYYSYRSPRNEYITVFYNADHNGYRQNQSITPQVYPNLPRSIDVPAFDEAKFKSTTQNKHQQFGQSNGITTTTTNKSSAYQNQI